MKTVSLLLLGSLRDYLLALLTRWNYNRTYPSMMFVTSLSRLRSNLRVEGPSQLPPLIDPKAHLRVFLSTARVTLFLHLPRPQIMVKGLLVNLLRGWQERSTSNTMVMDTSKRIIQIEEPSLLERWKRSKLQRKKIVKKNLKRKITPQSLLNLENC